MSAERESRAHSSSGGCRAAGSALTTPGDIHALRAARPSAGHRDFQIVGWKYAALVEVPGTAGQMWKARNRIAVSPSPREAGDGWVLDAVLPNGDRVAIAGFRTETEANDWLGSADHVTWLRETRATFRNRSAVAIFDRLASCAIAASHLASDFFAWVRHRWAAMEAIPLADSSIGARARLHASAWLHVASNLARRLARRWRSGCSGSRLRHRAVYRRVAAATVALLMLVTVFVILVAVLVMLGAGERPARFGSETTQLTANRPIVRSRSGEVTQAPDAIALLIDHTSSSGIATEPPAEAAAEIPSARSARDEGAAGDIPAAMPRRDPPRPAPPAMVGVWAPETGSCSARTGVLPAIISEHGARAGKTSCVFQEQRRTERDWRILAKCTNGREHWISNVRLVVKGDRLVWTSKRGTQAYTRCPNI